jgi:hypothetical protein
MASRVSLWQRIARFFRPAPETYETRRSRPGTPSDTTNPHFNQPTDQRGSGPIG